jgi:hypothetical protein
VDDVAHDVDIRLFPGNELAVVPDFSVGWMGMGSPAEPSDGEE